MSTQKHTPGPWKDAGLNGGHLSIEGELRCGVNATIARVWFCDDDMRVRDDLKYGEEVRANARLIAAAPELLEALQAAWEHLQYCGYGDKWERDCAQSSGLDKQIRAAISKATGGEQ